MRLVLLIILTLFLCSAKAFSQILSVEGFLANGNVLEEEFKAGKASFGIGGYYHFNERILAGIELGHGGNFLPVGTRRLEGDTSVLNPASFNFNTMMAKARLYLFDDFLNARIYAGLAIGYAKYFRRLNLSDVKQIANRSLLAIPELGLSLDRVNLSIQYYFPTNTPEYIGYSNDMPLVLAKGRYTMIMLRFAYQYPIVRQK
ncbi:MAG: hypothetical protein WBA74_05850 [Cyclobacteriaceae bacterium]